MHGALSRGYGRTPAVLFYPGTNMGWNPQDCNEIVTAKFFPFTLPDSKQVPLCEVSRTLSPF